MPMAGSPTATTAPRLEGNMDPNKGAALGVTPQAVGQTLQAMLGSQLKYRLHRGVSRHVDRKALEAQIQRGEFATESVCQI